MALFLVLLVTLAILAVASAGITAIESAFLRSVTPSGHPIKDVLAAKVQEMMSAMPKDIKEKALAADGIAPMASATVPAGYVSLNGCGAASNMAAAVPVGLCVPDSGVYLMWSWSSPNGVNTLTVSGYADSACATSALYSSTSIAGSCSVTGNSVSVGGQSSSVPAVPSGAGLVENFFTTNACGSVVGWVFTPQGSCMYGTPTYMTGTCTSTSLPVTTYGDGATQCTSSGGTSNSLALTSTCSILAGSTYLNSPFSNAMIAVTFGATYYTDTCQAAASETAVCFAGSETVTLASGEVKSIADVAVGDSVLAFSNGKAVFSDVIATPHPRNNVAADFQHIVTEAGSDIKLTADHLILSGACSTEQLPLVRAASVQTGACVQTVNGQEVVVSNEVVQSEGLYTVVTQNKADLVIVNGIVASPFAVNHAVGNAVYGIHRLVYAVAPALMASSAFKAVNAVASNLAAYFTK